MNRKRWSVGIALIGLTGWVSAVCWSQSNQGFIPAWSPPPVEISGNGALLMSSVVVPVASQQFVQQMTLVDTATKSIAVYHIQQETGVIVLKSVRRIDADFGLTEFNGAEPSPSKVRGIVNRGN